MVRDQLYGWSTDEGAWANQPTETTNGPVNENAWQPAITGPKANELRQKLATLNVSNMAADRVLMRAKMEEKEHLKRLAQLRRIIEVATADRNKEAVEKAKSLIVREDAGFILLVERIVKRLEKAQEMTGPGGMGPGGMGPGGMGGMGPGGMGGMSKEDMIQKMKERGMTEEEIQQKMQMMQKMQNKMGSTPGMPTYPQPQKNSGSGPASNFPDAPSLGDK